jgi:hypothetical protein
LPRAAEAAANWSAPRQQLDKAHEEFRHVRYKSSR